MIGVVRNLEGCTVRPFQAFVTNVGGVRAAWELFLDRYSWSSIRDVDSSCCRVPRAFCHNIQVWVLALVLRGYVAFSKDGFYSQSQLTHLENGENDPPLTTLPGFCCCSSDAKSCLTLCNPMDCSIQCFPVLHYFLEFAKIHVHWVRFGWGLSEVIHVKDLEQCLTHSRHSKPWCFSHWYFVCLKELGGREELSFLYNPLSVK